MASQLSRVLFSKFEQAISDDVNRIGQLTSREVQNLLRDGLRLNQYVDSAGVLDPIGAEGEVQQGLTKVPSIGTTGTAQIIVGPGEGYVTVTPGSADESDFAPIRWASTSLYPTSADPTDPRIDVLVAEGAVVDTDNLSRNILISPVSRTVVAQVVSKTRNPDAVLSVVAGTASPIPGVPAIASNQIPLCYVYIPAGVASSSGWGYAKAARLTTYPGSILHGFESGGSIGWTAVDESAVTSVPSLISLSGYSQAFINGELLLIQNANVTLMDDTSTPVPTSNATFAQPYYLYVCGGRNFPVMSGDQAPVILVASGVAPDSFGRAGAPLIVPLGTIPVTATLWAGCGWVTVTGDRSKYLRQSLDGWVSAVSGAFEDTQEISFSDTTPISTDQTISPKPATLGLEAMIALRYTGQTGSAPGGSPWYANLWPVGTYQASTPYSGVAVVDIGGTDQVFDPASVYCPLATSGNDVTIIGVTDSGTTTLKVVALATAFRLAIPRVRSI